jgi:hypothetical protein
MMTLAITTAEPNSKQINKGLTMKAMINGIIIRKSYVWCLIVHNLKGHGE